MRFTQPADACAAWSAAARRWPTCSCRSRSAATWRCSTLLNRAARSTRGRRSTSDFVDRALRRLRRAGRRTCAALDADALLGRHRPAGATRSTRRATMVAGAERIDRVLGDGPHPAQGTRCRRSARSSTCCCCAATSASPAPGVCPVRGHSNVQGDRTMGIYEKPRGRVPRRARRRVRLRAAARAGYDTVDAIRAMRDGEVDVFVAMGGNFVAAAPDTDATTAALAPLPAHRAGLDQAQPLARHAGRGGADPARASAAPSVDLTGGRAQFVTVEDSMSMVHALAGPLEPASPQLRSEVAIVCRLARARARRRRAASTGTSSSATTTASATTSRRSCPASSDFNERVRQPGGFALPHRRATTARSRRPPARPASPSTTFAADRGAARAPAAADDALPRPVQHDDLRPRRPLPRHHAGPPGRVRATPPTSPSSASPTATIVDIVSECSDGVERRAAGVPRRRVPDAAGTCAAYFPEANVLVPLDSVADGSNTPTSKSIVVRFERA